MYHSRPLSCLLTVLLVLLAAAPSAGTTGIVVHGYHRQAHNWEEVVWGDMANQHLGRLPQAALLAWESRHELATFICGSGASCDAAGRIEADAIVALLLSVCQRWRPLNVFAAWILSSSPSCCTAQL